MTISTILIAVGTLAMAVVMILINMPRLKEWLNIRRKIREAKSERKRRKNLKTKITRAELLEAVNMRITTADLLNTTRRISEMTEIMIVALIEIRDGLYEAKPNETIASENRSRLDSFNEVINSLAEARHEFNDYMREHDKQLDKEHAKGLYSSEKGLYNR